jgi:hypothetical protein
MLGAFYRYSTPPRPPPVEGGFASFNSRFQAVAGAGGLVCGPAGVTVARFGWVDFNSGLVYSARQAPSNRLGFVLPVNGTWQKIYRTTSASDGTCIRVLRAGLPVTVCLRGDFYVRFLGGASPGQAVYANPLDGTPSAGVVSGFELTPWTVVAGCNPGGLGIISTWATFSP